MESLSFAYIAEISPFYLADNRQLQAHIHYTVSRARHDHKEESSKTPYNPTSALELTSPRGWSLETNTFRIKDQKFIYFFPVWWPVEAVPEYLREEDIVPSGMYSLNCSRKNLERAVEQLKAEGATTSLTDIAVLEEVKVPIDSLDRLNDALYSCDRHAEEVVGYTEIPFNKPLLRVHRYGGKPERLNFKTKAWEGYTQERYRPGIRRMLREDVVVLFSS